MRQSALLYHYNGVACLVTQSGIGVQTVPTICTHTARRNCFKDSSLSAEMIHVVVILKRTQKPAVSPFQKSGRTSTTL